MYDYSKVNITESGKRIREYCKEHGIKQQDLASLIGYTGRNEVSACWNGERLLKPKYYEKMGKELGLRINWLLAFDDFPTTKDYLEYIQSKHDEKYNNACMFLSSQGYEISETDFVLFNGVQYINKTKLPKHCNHFEYDDVLEITSPNGEKSFIIKHQLYNLISDFFTLFEKRLVPRNVIESIIK